MFDARTQATSRALRWDALATITSLVAGLVVGTALHRSGSVPWWIVPIEALGAAFLRLLQMLVLPLLWCLVVGAVATSSRAAGAAGARTVAIFAVLYATAEPCIMCCGAAVHARVERVVYGASDPKGGAARSLYRLLEDPRLNHAVRVTAGVRAEECAALLTDFFREVRCSGGKRSV